MTRENDLPICVCWSSVAGEIGTRFTVLFSQFTGAISDEDTGNGSGRSVTIRHHLTHGQSHDTKDAATSIARTRSDGRNERKEPGIDRAPNRSIYWQLDATILTESTFSFGAVVLEVADAVEPELEVDERLDAPPSTVPVISTLWPTCGVS
jgi:hypothetical protein